MSETQQKRLNLEECLKAPEKPKPNQTKSRKQLNSTRTTIASPSGIDRRHGCCHGNKLSIAMNKVRQAREGNGGGKGSRGGGGGVN